MKVMRRVTQMLLAKRHDLLHDMRSLVIFNKNINGKKVVKFESVK